MADQAGEMYEVALSVMEEVQLVQPFQGEAFGDGFFAYPVPGILAALLAIVEEFLVLLACLVACCCYFNSPFSTHLLLACMHAVLFAPSFLDPVA